jgi:hypothetical protein
VYSEVPSGFRVQPGSSRPVTLIVAVEVPVEGMISSPSLTAKVTVRANVDGLPGFLSK